MKFALGNREKQLILSKDVCRLSTISPNGWPHSVPVSYVCLRGKFYVPSSRRAKKVTNLEKNNKATIVVDDEDIEHGVMIECKTKILDGDSAEPFKNHMREVKGWKNEENTIVIELAPVRNTSWFLK